jgi:signal transduction histidine kinase
MRGRLGVRPSLRWRLTAIYGGLFFAAGGLLLAVNYALVSQSLPNEKLAVRTQSAPPPGDPGFGGVVRSRQTFRGDGGDERDLVIVGGTPGDVAFVADLPKVLRSSALSGLVQRSLLALLGVGAASLGLGWWLAGRALRPVHRITDTARRLSGTNLDERIGLEGPNDELKELADTFDDMLERLDSAFDSQRRFVANASHELRTPLAIMRTQLETADTDDELRSASSVVRQTIDRSERLLDGLLVLARADGQLTMQPCDLADALRQANASVVGGDGDVAVTVVAEAAPVDGDPALLQHLARNLLDNARRHNVPGGWVRASTRVEDEWAVLEVANGGATIEPDAVESLWEPFRRLSPDRTGSVASAGLGLSIVRAVARAHGGDATAEPLALGGLRVEVRLPAALATATPRTRV